MVNKVILIGNAGNAAEVKELTNGDKVANFDMATNESYQDKAGQWKKVTEWHRIVAWRRLAEQVGKQVKKGTAVYIEGKLKTRNYEDKDGKQIYVTEVVATVFRKLTKEDVKNSD